MSQDLRGRRGAERTLARTVDDDFLSKFADVDLGSNPQSWFTTILSVFNSQHPELAGNEFARSLTFNKQDLVTGYATGSITISGGPHLLVFPVVVRDGRLAPFDLVFIDEQLRYADPELVQSYASPYRPTLGIASGKVPNAPTTTQVLHLNQIYPQMKTVLSSLGEPTEEHAERYYDIKGGSKLDFSKIAATITKEQRDKMAAWLLDNQGFYHNATSAFHDAIDSIRHISREEVQEKTASAKDYLAETWHDIALVKRADINSYEITLTKKMHNQYITFYGTSNDVRKLAQDYHYRPEKLLGKIDQLSVVGDIPVKISRLGAEYDHQKLAELTSMTDVGSHLGVPNEISGYGGYKVYFDRGGFQDASVFPLVDWEFKKIEDKIVISDSTFAIQQRVTGTPLSTPFKVARGNPTPGAWGAYVYESIDKNFCTMPFEVVAIKDTPAGLAISAVDLISGKRLNLVKVPGIKSLVKINPKDDPGLFEMGAINVYIPSVMEYINLPGASDGVGLAPSSVFKTAAVMRLVGGALDMSEVHLAELGDVRLESIKTARSNIVLNQNKVLVALAVTDHYNTKLAFDIMNGNIDGSHPRELEVYAAPEDGVVKTAEADATDLRVFAEHLIAKVDYASLMKVATVSEDSRTLDMVLSINLLNDRNVKYFLDNISILRDCEEYLARLLLTARITAVGLSEPDIKSALDSIVSIKKTLSQLGMLREE